MDLMTLPEYAKGLEVGDGNKPYIEVFAQSSDILQAIPFEGMRGATYEFYREAELPVLGFRAINQEGTRGSGKIEPFQESSFIIDHDLDVDRAIIDRHGESRRSREENMQVKAAGKLWTDTFLKGDNTTDPKEFNGVQKRATGDRVVNNSVAAGGAALSLYNLDEAVRRTYAPTHIIAPFDIQSRFMQAARNTGISGFVIQNWDEIARPKMTYAGLPILWGYPRTLDGGILPFTEVGAGGGAAVTTSIYVVSFSEGGLRGIQIRPMSVRDFGLLEDGITYRSHLTWDTGLVDEHPFALTRLTSITNAAFVA